MHQDNKSRWQQHCGPSHLGWALLISAILIAATLRFWQLGQIPPGLYRDEALNGLDALNVLAGKHSVFFAANNGREPIYIYLTAISIAIFGRSAMAVRLAAAVVGTFTTWITYQLAKSWFGWRVGLLSAGLWAITLWPVHLSRIGLRPIVLVPALALLFWLGTLAYRQRSKWLWLAAGLVYGVGFYTYLAIRFTPVLLLLMGLYLVLTGRRRALWPGICWFGLGVIVTLTPLAWLVVGQPQLLFGRASQVSILNPAINQGDLWNTLWQHLGRGLGLFFWQGDTIWRHNPAGRPVFDPFISLPFIVGLLWCARHWRKPAAAGLLMWIGVMLGPTILAEDTPHFLRAAGLLPALLVLPALGLAQLWNWERLSVTVRQGLVIGLLLASLADTVMDYARYGRQPDVAYLFEAAATEMAHQIRNERNETAIFVDERFWAEWPSISFLVDRRAVTLYQPEAGSLPQTGLPFVIYAWPYGPLDFVPQALHPPAIVSVEEGELARGDLDPVAAPLFVRYLLQPTPPQEMGRINFGGQLELRQAAITYPEDRGLEVELVWSSETTIQQDLVVFVHVTGSDGQLLAQDDAPVAGGHWPRQWWRPGLLIRDRHTIQLPKSFDAAQQQIHIGVYDAATRVRLSILDLAGEPTGDVWLYTDSWPKQP